MGERIMETKKNLKELLEKEIDKVRCLEQLQEFYTTKLQDDLSYKYIWDYWYRKTNRKMKVARKMIDYLQHSIKENE
jgi:hypothetical protein